MVKISLISPCYNEADSIESFIEAVFNQSYQDFEVVVVDGGSTDGTYEKARLYAEKYPGKLIVIKEVGERSPANAKNIGINRATGDLLYFKDVDCRLIDHEAFSKIVKCYLRLKQPDILYIRVNYISHLNGLIRRVIHYMHYSHGVDAVYRVDVAKKVLFDPNLGAGEDVDFHRRCLELTKATECSEQILIYYRPESLKRYIRRYKWYGRTFRSFYRKYPQEFKNALHEFKVSAYIIFFSITTLLILTSYPKLWPSLFLIAIPLVKHLIYSFKSSTIKRYFFIFALLSYLRAFSFTSGFILSFLSKGPLGREK